MDPEVLEALEEQLGDLQEQLGAELDEDDVAVLLARVGENAEETGYLDLYTAHNELVEEGEDDDYEDDDYEGDGFEDYVEGQTQMLEELSGKRLDYNEREALAFAARDSLDPEGNPDVQSAWDEQNGEIRDPATEVGRVERMAREIESARWEEEADEQLEEELGGGEEPIAFDAADDRSRQAALAQAIDEEAELQEDAA